MEAIELTQELSKSSMEVVDASTGTTKCDIPQFTPTLIATSYNTLPGNQPNTYGNYVALWQSSGEIPWNAEPLATQKIDTNTPDGSMIFSGVELTGNSYIVGYAVGPELSGDPRQSQGNMCAIAFIPATNSESSRIHFTPSISVTSILSNSIIIDYVLPTGVKPETNGAWIGIWKSTRPAYNTPPMAANKLQDDSSSGSGLINGVNILRGETYTVALFMSGWGGDCSSNDQRPMACYVTFKTK